MHSLHCNLVDRQFLRAVIRSKRGRPLRKMAMYTGTVAAQAILKPCGSLRISVASKEGLDGPTLRDNVKIFPKRNRQLFTPDTSLRLRSCGNVFFKDCRQCLNRNAPIHQLSYSAGRAT